MTSHFDLAQLALVALSLVIAVIASYSAIDLTGRVAASRGLARRAWLSGGSLALGSGIWAMHFTAMLAHPFPAPIEYDLPIVALSLLVAVAITVPAMVLGGGASLSWPRLLGGGGLVGAGIISMHYIGMAAIRGVALRYSPPLVALSVAIAVGAGTLALNVAFALRSTTGLPALRRKLGAAVILGVAISGMHYTGMAATTFVPLAGLSVTGLQTATLPLGIGIALVTILILGLTLAMGLLDRRLDQQIEARARAEQRYQSLFARHPDAIVALTFDGVCHEANPAAAALLGQEAGAIRGQSLLDLAPGAARPALQSALTTLQAGVATTGALEWPTSAGEPRSLHVTYVPIIIDAVVAGAYMIAHDETARVAAEAAERASLAALAEAQVAERRLRDTIAAMDTPILPVAEGVLVVPLIGDLDAARGEELLARVLARAAATRAHTLLLDITGVPLVDQPAAAALVRLGQALRLLGARCMLVGLSGEAAQTLVHLGLDLSTLDTRRDLQEGLRAARQTASRRLTIATSARPGDPAPPPAPPQYDQEL